MNKETLLPFVSLAVSVSLFFYTPSSSAEEEGSAAGEAPGEWVIVKAGTYLRGSPDAEPGHGNSEGQKKVRIAHNFSIQSTEVTQDQWSKVIYGNPSSLDCSDCPRNRVSWFDAARYCNKLSENTGMSQCYECGSPLDLGLPDGPTHLCVVAKAYRKNFYRCPGYRLPTSEEWEYAARAGITTATYNGNVDSDSRSCSESKVLDPIAWYCGNAMDKVHPVGQKQPNAWGLYDMLGNVAEWTNDQAPWTSRHYMVRRGGSFLDTALNMRSAALAALSPENGRAPYLGFRPVKTIIRGRKRR